jgi:hypothetical protein
MDSGAERVNDVAARDGASEDVSLIAPELPCAEPQALSEPASARLTPQRYKVQFTASEEYVKLVEEAQALLSSSAGRTTLDELQLRAMRALVTELKRQKYAVTARSRKSADVTLSPPAPAPEAEQADRNGSTDEPEPVHEPKPAPEHKHTRRRGRYVPAAVRRDVFARDEARCTYADASGRRCRETHSLELHHLTPFAHGGPHTPSNLTLRCRAHNALAAEQDFGRDFIELKRDSNAHELAATLKRFDSRKAATGDGTHASIIANVTPVPSRKRIARSIAGPHPAPTCLEHRTQSLDSLSVGALGEHLRS